MPNSYQHSNSKLRRKILKDPDARRAIHRVMKGDGPLEVKIDGKTYTVERLCIWDRPMDDELDELDWSLRDMIICLYFRVLEVFGVFRERND